MPARRTLERLGIPRATFHRWYDRFLTGGVDALEDRSPRPGRVWNRIPQDVRDRIVELALEMPEPSPRELAVTFTDTQSYFVSEASVYRLLKAHDLITSSAFIVIKAADEFKDKTTAPNHLWQTDFTYLKVIGWGWFYLSTILDDFSRNIIAWKLCTTMKAEDVTDTLANRQPADAAADLDLDARQPVKGSTRILAAGCNNSLRLQGGAHSSPLQPPVFSFSSPMEEDGETASAPSAASAKSENDAFSKP